MKSALVILASGIGNVIRWTPIVPILVERGYIVDVWIVAPDYPEVASLLEPSPMIRRVMISGLLTKAEAPPDAYDLAIVTRWVPPFILEQILAVERLEAPAEFWLQHGDRGAVVWTATQLGYINPIPKPVVHASSLRFGLEPSTIAIHAGRKAGWDQKQWHGFGELLRYFERFVLIGAGEDWTGHELGDYARHLARGRDYVGQLTLRDTAALLTECVGVVTIDSGISHIAAALGIATFPIYGITRARREAFALPNVYPIENRAACAPSCATIRYNARTCPGGLACLSTLTAETVAAKVRSVLMLEAPADAPAAAAE